MRQERINACIGAEFEAGGSWTSGVIRNASEGGMFVRTTQIPAVGEPVEIRFTAAGGRPVQLSGMVWWNTEDGQTNFARPPGFGVRLLGDAMDLDWIDRA